MKGANPFPLWGEDPQSVVGRSNAVGIFNSYLNSVSSGQPVVVLMRGGPGAGKTILIRRLRRNSEKERFASPYIKVEKGEDLRAVVAKLHNELIGFMRSQAEGPRAFRYKEPIAALERHSVGTIEGLIRASGGDLRKILPGVIFFIDDFDRMRKAGEGFGKLAKAVSKSRLPVGFVVSTTKELSMDNPVVRVFSLAPLTFHDVQELVTKALGKGPPKMGEQCLKSIVNDSGGNPRLVKTICWLLYDRLKETDKIITRGHYLAALPSLMSLLGREWFGRLYSDTPAAEREILKALAKEGKYMHISDVAERMGRPMGPTTALAKRLLERGQIVKIDRGAYSIFSRLYGRYVLSMG